MPHTITQLLHEWSDGNEQALERLLPLVYNQLHALAARQLNNEHHVTLQPTELVNEAFLRLSGNHSQVFRNRMHFYGAAAELMRRVLIDLARRRGASKRGSTMMRVELNEDSLVTGHELDVEGLDRALEKLAKLDARQAEVVKLRFFGGLSIPQVAECLHISEATVKRDWLVAKAWLMREMSRK